MSLCPICGRVYCDHSPGERGQTIDEMMRELSPEEMEAWEGADSERKKVAARKHAHDPVTDRPVFMLAKRPEGK